MSEHIIAEKFVYYYYTLLSHGAGSLSTIYGDDSVVCYHDLYRDSATYVGRKRIAEGLKEMNLFGAAADLQNGSIDCVQCGASDYMLVVTGQLRFGSATRSFTQSFLLSELTDSQQGAPDDGVKRAVFYVRSEVLTLNSGENKDEVSPREEAPVQIKQAAPAEDVMEQRPHREAPTPHREAPTPRREAMSEDRPKSGKPSFEIIFVKDIPEAITESDISDAFKSYGQICHIKIFPTKSYATVSFPKTGDDYYSHETFDRIMKNNPTFTIRGEVVRLEPFMLNHKKTYYDRNRPIHRHHSKSYKGE
ncbi:hypothetical protein WA538_006047 [Blastocystis sp. DL]